MPWDKVKRVKVENEILFELAILGLEQNESIKLLVVGNSMYPLLRSKIDSVELIKSSFDEIRKGDIVLARYHNSQYILHRVHKKNKSGFYMLGDALKKTDGPYDKEDVIAKASAIYRKDKKMACGSCVLRAYSVLWRLLFPFRKMIIDAYKRLKKYLHVGVRA